METELSSARPRFRCLSIAATLIATAIGLVPAAGAVVPDPGVASSPVRTAVDRASFVVSPSTGRPGSRFIATLRNEGVSTIEVGNPFSIARRTPDGWKRLRHGRRCVWTMEAYLLRPGGSFSQRVGWFGPRCSYRRLQSGTYRVSKRIRFTDDVSPAREDIVRARFRVVG